jgi:phosphoribosylglycinamide formyltransferase-1
VIFASGSGSNAVKIYEYFKNNDQINIAGLYCNNSSAAVVTKFQKFKVNIVLFDKNELENSSVLKLLLKTDLSLIVLAGFLLKMPKKIVDHFENKIINIHPALLPSYGGKGMYGMRIHKKVVENNELYSGLTIHYVNQEYDEGAAIFQKKIKLSKNETPETLSKKILSLEHSIYSRVIEKILQNE